MLEKLTTGLGPDPHHDNHGPSRSSTTLRDYADELAAEEAAPFSSEGAVSLATCSTLRLLRSPR